MAASSHVRPVPRLAAFGAGSRAAGPAPAAPGFGFLGAGAALALVLIWGAAVAMADLNAVFLCVSLIASIAIFFDFRVGVVMLALLMPISASDLFPHQMLGVLGLNPLNVLLAATLGSWFFQSLASRRGASSIAHFIPGALLWLYIVPIVIAGILGSQHVGDIAVGAAEREMISFEDSFGYLRDVLVKPMLMVVFALLLGAAVARSRQAERFLTAMIVSVWIMSLLAVVYFVLSDASLREISGSTARAFFMPLGLHSNDLGRLYATAYALLLFTWGDTDDPKLGVPLLATMGIVVIALLLTFSRGAFMAFLIVNLLFVVMRRGPKSLLIVGCLAAGLLVLGGIVIARMQMGFGGGANAITAGRVEEIWLPLLPELLRTPFYGNGLLAFMWSEAMREGAVLSVTHPHNAYIRTLLDMGILGLVLVCAYFARVLSSMYRLGRDPDVSATLRGFFKGGAAGLLAFLIAGMAGSGLTPVPEQAFIWFAIGMMYGHLHLVRERRRQERLAGGQATARGQESASPIRHQ